MLRSNYGALKELLCRCSIAPSLYRALKTIKNSSEFNDSFHSEWNSSSNFISNISGSKHFFQKSSKHKKRTMQCQGISFINNVNDGFDVHNINKRHPTSFLNVNKHKSRTYTAACKNKGEKFPTFLLSISCLPYFSSINSQVDGNWT